MNICFECNRLLEESNAAVRSHTTLLAQICEKSKDYGTLTRLKLGREVQEAAELRKRTRHAFDDHLDNHAKVESDRLLRTSKVGEKLGATA